MAVANSVAAALAPATNNQYAGAAHIFVMFCMYIEDDNFALPASDTVLCLYLQWQSLTVDPKKSQDKVVCHPPLVRTTGLRVDPTIGEIHGPPVHYGTEATLSHTGETQTPYHTGITHAHENVPEHRLVHTHHCGRLGGNADRILLFPTEGQLYSEQGRCFQLAQAPLSWRRSFWQDRRHIHVFATLRRNSSTLVYTGQRLSVSLATPSTQFKH